MNQEETPLYDALHRFQIKQPLSLHVPGHKSGSVFPKKALNEFRSILPIDLTELEGLDDLHHPEGPIAEAMVLLSDYYRTEKSFFLLNGSTAGNLAMIFAMTSRGDQILVQRNAHKSVYHALQMRDLRPVFINPVIDSVTDLPLGLTQSSVEKAIKRYPSAKVLVLTYPNYYGMASSLKEIIDYAHSKQVKVLVDEAHGAHFTLGGTVPESALEMGADIVVHSAHKTLPAMTMGSYLHINSSSVPVHQVEKWLGRLQSSSPSYPIMASLDLARYYLATRPMEEVTERIEQIQRFKTRIASISGLSVPKPSPLYKQDPFKVLIQTRKSLSGLGLQQELAAQGIYTELAGPAHILMLFGIGQPFNEKELAAVLETLLDKYDNVEASSKNVIRTPEILSLEMTYEEMDRMQSVELPLNESAAGYFAAEHLIPYPPGVPIVMQGERFSKELLNHLIFLKENGTRFQGGHLIEKGFIRVYDRVE